MKKLLYIGLAAAAGLAFFACSKDTVKGTDTPEEPTGKLVTITASIPAEGLATKVSFAENETTLRLTKLSWEAGDVLDIAGKEFKIDDNSISPDGKTASFTGKEPTSAPPYTVTYNSITSKGINLNAQEQDSNGSTNHLGYSIVVEASDYKTVSFENATSQSSVLQLRAKLPAAIKNAVKKVIFKSNLAVFNGGKQLTVALTNGTTGSDNLLNVYATLPAGAQTLSDKMELLIQFQVDADKEYEKYTAYREFGSGKEFIKDGAAQYIGIDCTNIESYANKTNDQIEIGTIGNPYLIGDQHQLDAVHGELKENETKYFKLVDDVDMTGISWVAFNNGGSYNKAINFDGGNHTISNLTTAKNSGYPSFAGIVNGNYKNLTIDHAIVDGGNNNAGVFASYVGTTGITGHCSGVTVQNSKITGKATSNSRNYGIFCGVVGGADSTIDDCHVDNSSVSQSTESNTACSVGGLIGNVNAACKITNCTVSADVENKKSYYTGGFIGQIGGGASVGKAIITDCAYLGGTITAGGSATTNNPVGGFVGRIADAGGDFTDCYVDGAKITAVSSGRIGGFIGDSGSSANTVCTSCYVKNTTLSGAQHVGGFGGVLYTKADKCYVESTTITANNVNVGGFAGYLQRATAVITNCFAAVTINGGNISNIGGFIGRCLNNASVSNCYENSSITSTGSSVGAFIGHVAAAPASVTKCIAWNGTLDFVGGSDSGVDASSVITGNYIGTSGTVSSQATTLGWDPSIWDFSTAFPTLIGVN